MSSMKIRGAALISLLLISGCSILSHPKVKPSARSDHRVQEICDYFNPFFEAEFQVENISNSNLVHSADGRIGIGNGCKFNSDESELHTLGLVTLSSTPPEQFPSVSPRIITVKGNSIEIFDPDPHGTSINPDYHGMAFLRVRIDGWNGDMQINSHDPAVFQRGAEKLVDMVEALRA
ncbi:hypothetical protein [Nocardia nova]|uniref:hypothetical protein n=1 Tax=Nocardia nova TaxID=37330 RepID=UPI00340F28D1